MSAAPASSSAERGVRRCLRLGVALVLACVACTQRPTPSTQTRDRTLESIAKTCAFDARRASGLELIESVAHPEESLLWLRALAVSSVDAPPDDKLNKLLDCDRLASGDCRFHLTQNSAEAVVVSRVGMEELRPVRGPLDVERLERYITWSARPESLTVRETRPGRLEMHADLGPNSVVLVRRDFDRAWRVEPASVELREDPIGYLVLVPRRSSQPLDILLVSQAPLGRPAAQDRQALDQGEFPIIQAEGVVDGTTFAGPPFQPGALLSIFGRRFGDADNEVRVGDSTAEILYESATQINVRLPGKLRIGTHDLAVTSQGRSTEPYPIEVSR